MADAKPNLSGASLSGASLSAGDAVPNFDLPTNGGGRTSLAALRGKPFVLYFYPKADTSGCTQEARAFQDALDVPGQGRIPVIGVSKDPVKAIEAFARKADLRFVLATDEAGAVLESYGVWVEKSMYGRTYMGIERSTFLVDAAGRLVRAWRRVKVPGHAAEVMREAMTLGA